MPSSGRTSCERPLLSIELLGQIFFEVVPLVLSFLRVWADIKENSRSGNYSVILQQQVVILGSLHHASMKSQHTGLLEEDIQHRVSA